VNTALKEVYPAQAGDFTQGLMELGATICGPNRKPDCEICPCKDFCLALKIGTAEALPVKLPKKERKEEKMTLFICSCQGKYAVQKRKNTGLLASLWQFPNSKGHLDAQQAVDAAKEMGLQPQEIFFSLEKEHIFTHVRWDMRGYYMEVANQAEAWKWYTADEIEANIPLPTAFRQFWEARPE
jgi:A/G-specific adenine glycosylase